MGLINVYNSLSSEHTSFKANGKIRDVFAEYTKNSIILKQGARLTDDYVITDDDIIFCRVAPRGIEALTTIAIVSAVIAAGVGVGAMIYANKQSDKIKEEYERQQKAAKDKADSINSLPFLKGAKNQTALGRTIPYIMGKMYFTPYLINSGYYSIGGTDGKEQYWNALLCCGYNNQRLESLSIGNTKIKDFDINAYSQDGVETIENSTYGNIDLEVCSNGELYANGLTQKVVSEVYGEEIKHAYGKDAEPLVKQLSENAQRVEVCIQFNGLRQYETTSTSQGWVQREVEITPYWCNNVSDSTPVWHKFDFKVNSTTYQWETLDAAGIEQAINDGILKTSTTRVQTGQSSYTTCLVYIPCSSEIKVNCSNILEGAWTVQRQIAVTTVSNKIARNTNDTIRFIATKDFTAAESFGKSISIKLVRENACVEDSSAQETAVLQYINTFCYDAVKSTSSALVPCLPMEQPFRDQTLRLGLRVKAGANTENILDEINVITHGLAAEFSNNTVNSYKTPTRNPIAWIYDILTSDYHKPSKYNSSEINLTSFAAAYTYCEENGFKCDTVVTQGTKKQSLIENILGTIGASLIIGSDGLLEIAIDKKETTPVALLNSQSVKNITYAKTFEKPITGLKTSYTDGKNWAIATSYFMRDGRTTYNQLTDRLSELSLDTVKEYNHAYKVAQRKQRQSILQPRTITAEVGLEGELYPLYSLVMLQMEQLKQGICSSVIKDLKVVNNYITDVIISDTVEIVDNKRYGVIIQAANNNGRRYINVEITNEAGKTNTLKLKNAIQRSGIYPNLFNTLSFGLLNDDGTFTKVTNPMKIYDIKPANDHGWNLELKDYNEEIYEYGVIPDYKSNLTSRPTTKVSLPTVTLETVNASLTESKAYTKQTADGLSQRIDSIVTTATVCSADKLNEVYDVDANNETYQVKETEINVTLRQGENELDFFIGDLILPSGFTYRVDGKKIYITVGEGVRIKSGNFAISIRYKAITEVKYYVDQNGKKYVNQDGIPYRSYKYANSYTEWKLYFNYFGSGNPLYLGLITNVANIPSSTNMGNYFVWGGTDRTVTTLTSDGLLLQGRCYKFVGTSKSWYYERDTDSGHSQIVLGDVLSLANADLENNNSTVWEYLDHLTSNTIFADMLTANEAFINELSSKIVTAELVTTEELNTSIGNVYKEFTAGNVDLSAYNFADADDVPNGANILKSTQVLYYRTSSPTAPDKPTTSTTISDSNINDGWTTYAVSPTTANKYIYTSTKKTNYDNSVSFADVTTAIKTVINGAYINTGVIEAKSITADKLNVDYINAKYLTSGDAQFIGKITSSSVSATKGLYTNLYNGSSLSAFFTHISLISDYARGDLLATGIIYFRETANKLLHELEVYGASDFEYQQSSVILKFKCFQSVYHTITGMPVLSTIVYINSKDQRTGTITNTLSLYEGFVSNYTSWTSASKLIDITESFHTFGYILHI